ncbi:hypothetical protein P0082_11375 [Candidatus Haliotispira prima]|uniref:Uncharacterized protein n=1 Tax=Candidatus Haliotispira prima TaxID=3034016 RepID=A0ABY8MGD7_9SPIO|nr:hypothetical protein P0082_11375 [Candidatus Haliotispira prima]
MRMLNWDESTMETESEEDFISSTSSNMRGHNEEVKYCVLNDPDCEACQ